jgi:hypothetical protein
MKRRNCKLSLCQLATKSLTRLSKAKWVPNGRSEQPQRKPGVRESFRACGLGPRCTSVVQDRPNSRVFRGPLSDRETVRIGNVGGREDSNSRYLIGPNRRVVGVSIRPAYAANSLILRVSGWSFAVCERDSKRVVGRPWTAWRGVRRRFLSGAQPEKSELSLCALAKPAVAASQLCYSPSRGEGRNGRRLALAR